MSDGLEPIAPQEAVSPYLDHRQPELSTKTLQNHKYRLNADRRTEREKMEQRREKLERDD